MNTGGEMTTFSVLTQLYTFRSSQDLHFLLFPALGFWSQGISLYLQAAAALLSDS